jgi:hypothetical protein
MADFSTETKGTRRYWNTLEVLKEQLPPIILYFAKLKAKFRYYKIYK